MKEPKRGSGSDGSGHDFRVLVVEDDTDIRDLAAKALKSAGFEVREAGTVAEAWRCFNERRPDLVLLDNYLPDGKGCDVCRKLREIAGEDYPVVLMTVRSDLKTRLRCFEAGAQDFISKPFYVEELIERVRVRLISSRKKQSTGRRREIVDMIAHDLKQPLSAISGSLKLINQQYLITDEVCRRLLENSEHAAESMFRLINDILDVGKSGSGRLEVRRESVRVSELLEGVRTLFEAGCAMRSVECRVSVIPGDLTFFTDRGLIFRILANLLQNGVKCSREGSEILMECSRDGSGARFSVSDLGPGIPDGDKERIFGKNVYLETDASQAPTGHGIGLYFCRDAAKALGGKVWVEDREGGGSRFVLELPLRIAGSPIS
ncbi:response regulator [Elusimicrobiota bacterium]